MRVEGPVRERGGLLAPIRPTGVWGATLRPVIVGDEQAAALRQHGVYQLVQEQLGDWDRVLVGQDVILRHLAQLGVTTWNKRSPRWTTVRRWARWQGFPLLRGTKCGRNYFCSVTTQHAVTAWLLSPPGELRRVGAGAPWPLSPQLRRA